MRGAANTEAPQVLEQAGLVSRSRDAQWRPAHVEAEVLDLMTKGTIKGPPS